MRRRAFISSSLGAGIWSACSRSALVSVAGAFASRSASAQVSIPENTWVRRPGPTAPTGPTGPNKHVKMTYSSSDHKVYLVGGDYTVPGVTNGASHEMVYRYDVATDAWENVLTYANSGTVGFPEGRCAPGWTYDSKRDVMWFGMGQNRQSTPRPGLLRGGLWTYDAKATQTQAWKLEGPDVPNPWSLGSPKLHANTGSDVWYMHYDPGTDALYVPYQGGGVFLAKYDLNGISIRNGIPKDHWSYTTLSTPDYFLGEVSFALDSKRGAFVFYFPWPGRTDTSPGISRGETWEYVTSTGTWRKLADTVLPAKSCFGMVYDSAGDKIVLFAGYDSHEGGLAEPINETWVFDRNPASPDYHQWVRLSVAGTPPTPRKGETIAYNAFHNVIVQFGGRGWDTQPDASDVYLLRLGGVVRPRAPTGLQVQ